MKLDTSGTVNYSSKTHPNFIPTCNKISIRKFKNKLFKM